jgi:hypothetical protein
VLTGIGGEGETAGIGGCRDGGRQLELHGRRRFIWPSATERSAERAARHRAPPGGDGWPGSAPERRPSRRLGWGRKLV